MALATGKERMLCEYVARWQRYDWITYTFRFYEMEILAYLDLYLW